MQLKQQLSKALSLFFLSFILLFITTISNQVHAQTCQFFHKSKSCSEDLEYGFSYFGQSRSALCEVDTTYSLEVTLYGQKDYVFSVCTESGFGPVVFKLVDKSTGKILYNNLEDELYQSIGFTIDEPQKVIIELSVRSDRKKPEDFSENRACVGVLIMWRKVARLGF
jgi:hypothetical protein